MSCFCGGNRGTPLSRFEKKAAPVLRKLNQMRQQHTQLAHAHSGQYQAARADALARYQKDEPVLAFAAALDALRHERQCKRLMNFVRQIGDSISKIDSVWASHSVVEGFEEISNELHSLAAPDSDDDDGDGVAATAREQIDVSQNLHNEFDALENEVKKISVVDETGTAMDDAAIEAQIQEWQKTPASKNILSKEDRRAIRPENFLMDTDDGEE